MALANSRLAKCQSMIEEGVDAQHQRLVRVPGCLQPGQGVVIAQLLLGVLQPHLRTSHVNFVLAISGGEGIYLKQPVPDVEEDFLRLHWMVGEARRLHLRHFVKRHSRLEGRSLQTGRLHRQSQ